MAEIDRGFCEPDYFRRTPVDEVRGLEAERQDLQAEITGLLAEWEAIEAEVAALERPLPA